MTMNKSNLQRATYERLMTNWDKGLYTLVIDKNEYYRLFSTKDEDGNLRFSGFCSIKQEAISRNGEYNGYNQEDIEQRSEENDWRIVRTIHPSELMGKGFKVEDKVRVRKGEYKGKIGKVKGVNGNFVYIRMKHSVGNFYSDRLEPYFEDEEETVTVQISKASLEELKKSGIKIIK